MNLLRHMAIRIWISIFFWMLFVIWMFPLLQKLTGIQWLIIPAILLLAGIFISVGMIMQQLAYVRINRLLKDASVRERAGMVVEAESALNEAVAIFDSFLLSPKARTVYEDKLLIKAAQHRIAHSGKSVALDRWVFAYLDRFPENEDAAQIWLQSVLEADGLPPKYFELIGKLSKRQPDNKSLQQLIGQIFLSEGRTDFEALQVYRRILEADGVFDSKFLNELAHLLAVEGFADEWALRIYLKAYPISFDSPRILQGILSCVENISTHERNRHLMIQAQNLLAKKRLRQTDFDETKGTLQMLQPTKELVPMESQAPLTLSESDTAITPTQLLATKVLSKKRRPDQKAAHIQLRHIGRRTFYAIANQSQELFANVSKLIRRGNSFGMFRWVVIGIILSGFMFFIVKMVMVPSENHLPEKSTSALSETKVNPFTIQVAAFKSQNEAEKYIQKLKRHNLDVYVTEARLSDKKWYQIRISHFADPKKAKTFGETLKSKGIIDDYYVARFKPYRAR
jgi:tetratricopeptide (TPR) repeat protein